MIQKSKEPIQTCGKQSLVHLQAGIAWDIERFKEIAIIVLDDMYYGDFHTNMPHAFPGVRKWRAADINCQQA